MLGDDGAYGQISGSPGSVRIEGRGTVRFGLASAFSGINASGPLTLGPDLVVRGGRGFVGSASHPVILEGLVRADSSGYAVDLRGDPFTNHGALHAAGGALTTAQSVVNAGTV